MYSKTEYFAELTRLIGQTSAGSRILLASMSFEPDEPEIAAILASLEAAAGRGADVTLVIDAHSFLVDGYQPGPLWYGRSTSGMSSAAFRRKQAALDRLNSYKTARTVVINRPALRFSLHLAGRSHIKTAIIDDAVFVGGCNLAEPSYIDLMAGWRDQATADELYAILMHAVDIGNVSKALGGTDQTIRISSGAKLLLDSGVRGQSLILDEALALIDSAEEWLTITCQYFPNSVTAQHLLVARNRGVKVEVLYAHPRHQGLVGGPGQQFSILLERLRLPADMFAAGLGPDTPMLHAKVIACDKGLMVGSHNYVRAGVQLGTAEIALLSSDPALARRAADAIQVNLSR